MVTRLTPADFAKLETESWNDRATVERFGLRRVDRYEGAQLIGRKARENYAGIAFPVFAPGQPNVREWFLRLDQPLMLNGKLVRYLGPPGRANIIIFGPGESMESLTDVRMPIVLVEGIKKLIAAYRLARYNCDRLRFLACGITGCWNWRGVIGKTTDPKGGRKDVKGPIADLARIKWSGRSVVVVFDSDCLTNPSVYAARRDFLTELRKRGARAVALNLPVEGVAHG